MFYCQNFKNSIINKINTQNIILVRLREAYAIGKIFLCLIEKKNVCLLCHNFAFRFIAFRLLFTGFTNTEIFHRWVGGKEHA